MWSLFKKRSNRSSIFEFLNADMHSHLLPDVDDGVKGKMMALSFINELTALGYKKLIITPHIYDEFYPNNKQDLLERFEILKASVKEEGYDIEVRLAAEYYIDNKFRELVQNHDLLTFGDKFVLVETSFVSLPLNFESILFELITSGYRPILAHPERYNYLSGNLKYFKHLCESGVSLQINMLSLTGYYGRESHKMAEYLLKEKMVSFIGTDLHHERHLKLIQKIDFSDSFFRLLKSQPILNGQI